jgi:hypothetical protein
MKISLFKCAVIAFAFILIFVVLYVYFINTAVKFTATTIHIGSINPSSDMANLKSSFNISKKEEGNIDSNPQNYKYVTILFDANIKYNSFKFIKTENSYNNIIVGIPWVNTFNPNGYVYFYTGDTSEQELYFIVDSKGKTDQEIFNMLKMNGDIYITGSILAINCRGKVDIQAAHIMRW